MGDAACPACVPSSPGWPALARRLGRPRFLVLEGVDGSGKSTHAARLALELGALLTHEPGGTDLGARLRPLLLDPGLPPLAPRAEALLLAADRAQHVEEVIRPALAAGRHVVSDRHAGSSVAYQGFGRGLAPSEVAALSRWAAAGVTPDLVILLDCPAADAAARRGADRLEREGEEFFARVAAGFAAQAAAAPDRWAVVDGRGSIDEVAARVQAAVASRLAGREQ
ncbi:MAG: dTMP kinase [Acidimicrobiales bacterium]